MEIQTALPNTNKGGHDERFYAWEQHHADAKLQPQTKRFRTLAELISELAAEPS